MKKRVYEAKNSVHAIETWMNTVLDKQEPILRNTQRRKLGWYGRIYIMKETKVTYSYQVMNFTFNLPLMKKKKTIEKVAVSDHKNGKNIPSAEKIIQGAKKQKDDKEKC